MTLVRDSKDLFLRSMTSIPGGKTKRNMSTVHLRVEIVQGIYQARKKYRFTMIIMIISITIIAIIIVISIRLKLNLHSLIRKVQKNQNKQ